MRLRSSQIRDPRQHPFEPHPPEISIGGRVPSVDASDGRGGSSGDNQLVTVCAISNRAIQAGLDTYVLERPSAHGSDAFLEQSDHEANRVDHELKKH